MRRLSFLAALLLGGLAGSQNLSAQGHADPSPVRASRVILRVSDLGKSLAYYRDRVGLRLQMSNDEFAVFDGGSGISIMLAMATRPQSGASTGLAAFTEVVLESPDVLAAHAAMQARGVTFRLAPRPVTTDGARDLYAADFRDPDGHVLSITGWVTRTRP